MTNQKAVMAATKKTLKGLPIGPLLVSSKTAIGRRTFAGSTAYWERRYAAGEHSGKGSLGDLARYKSSVLNAFVAEHDISSVLEFGCGDGNQLALACYPSYVGLEVAGSAVDACARRYADDPGKSFLWFDPARFVNHGALTADLTLSLDVVYHLVEDDVFARHLAQLFEAARRYVVIYATDFDRPKNGAHVRHRRFTPEVARTQPGWRLVDTLDNPLFGKGTEAQFHIYAKK
ncbi:MAG: class I SAM-dependent methyltransferase [Mycobacteriales bacterium]